jgi:alpha-ketoglutarate-dependent taurine dioxygenase
MSIANVEDIYTLSQAQHGILFQALAGAEPGMYLEQLTCVLRGNLNTGAFEQAWQATLDRHASLRTAFRWKSLSKPIQVVYRRVKLSPKFLDWRHLSAAEQASRFEAFQRAERQQNVDLSAPPLMRLSLIRLTDDSYQFAWSIHHLIHDAWSIYIIINDFLTFYDGLCQDRQVNLSPSPRYRDFISWLKQQDSSSTETFWRGFLKGFTQPASISIERSPAQPVDQSEDYRRQELQLSPQTTALLMTLAQRHQLTLNIIVQAAWAFWLGHSCGRRDVVFGVSMSGRPPSLERVEDMVGMFVNTLPMRAQLDPDRRFLSFLEEIQRRQNELSRYEHTPLGQIQQWSDVAKGLPLFETLLNFLSPAFALSREQIGGLKVETLHGMVRSNYPLAVTITPGPRLLLEFLYDVRRFDPGAVTLLRAEIETLLEEVATRPETKLGELASVIAGVSARRREAISRQRRNAIGSKLKTAKPQILKLSTGSLVEVDSLSPGGTFPLFIRPKAAEVDLAGWTRANRSYIEEQLLQAGAILFRGFKVNSVDMFAEFVRSFSPVLLEYRERSTPRREVGASIYTSTEYPAHQNIAFHNEFSYAYTWPMKIAFHCAKPAEAGGETPIADSRRVFQLIGPAVRERFIEKGVAYVRNYGNGIDLTWQEAYQTADRTQVERHCRNALIEFEWRDGDRLKTWQVRPAVAQSPKTDAMVWFNQAHLFHLSNLEKDVQESMLKTFGESDLPRNAYYGDGTPIEASALEEVREAYERASVSFPWQEGDVLLLDNMLTAHGRRPFTGKREVLVAMAEPYSSGPPPV